VNVLFVVGALFEFAGIVLLGFPDFVPGALRLSRWLRPRTRSVVNRLRRLLRLPPRPTFVDLGGAVEIHGVLRGSAMKSVAAGASLEEKVAFLLRRDEEAQGAVNALAERVAAIEEQAPRQLEQLRGEMQAHVDQKIRAALDEYRELRVAGTVALGLGLACVTVANFV
jgi:hypothetical protein